MPPKCQALCWVLGIKLILSSLQTYKVPDCTTGPSSSKRRDTPDIGLQLQGMLGAWESPSLWEEDADHEGRGVRNMDTSRFLSTGLSHSQTNKLYWERIYIAFNSPI